MRFCTNDKILLLIKRCYFDEHLYLVVDKVAHTIAMIVFKIQRQRAVLMQANVSPMFNCLYFKTVYSRSKAKLLKS